MEEEDGKSVPSMDSINSAGESHPDQIPKDVLGPKGGILHWNETLRPLQEGPSAVSGQCWNAYLGMHQPGCWQPFILYIAETAQDIITLLPPQRGISSIATLRFITIESSLRLVY